MKTELISIGKIKPNKDNPRIIKDDKFHKLVNSIKEFPQMLEIRPIVVNDEMVVLGGNMRLKACKEAKLKEVPIIIADNLTEQQQREFIIKDNISGGEWDWDVLDNEWNNEELEYWGIDIPIFNSEEDDEKTSQSIDDFNITIKCDSIDELEKIMTKLDIQDKKISAKTFLIKAAL